ncbi:helix-turn-helix domain-containing protein [Vibrio palustris]|uniref:Uncharacterized protein n=1 Tax=Vibrio palustris TaxID=1918946 RepID=A0A1R4B3C8_9VIBR|nr:helix-turn-helix domain-containing protein [Vibrio palustris]SJL83419.1 hypothetical protein VPAL9027_01385 [Vibrio palustris]
MNQITFKHIETSRTITMDINLKMLKSFGREVFIQDSAVLFLFERFFTHKNVFVEYSDIASIVREKKSTFHMEDCADSIIANKYIFKSRNILKNLMIDDFIVTVRGVGYKVSNKWLPVSGKSKDEDQKDVFLNTITNIIQDSIKYSEAAEISHDRSGFSFIKPNKEKALEHFSRIDDCYHSFLDCYSEPGNSIELLELREKITKVLLYVIYWRVGDSLTDDKFRSDYKNELNILLRQLKQAVDLIK